MNKKIRIILIILISTILIFKLPVYSIADDGPWSLDDVIKNADSFLNVPDESGKSIVINTPDEGELQKLSKSVSGVLLTVAFAVTFISIAVMGVNFAIQSVDDKAKIKEAMIPWIIGIFVSFGAYGIWKITMGIFYKLV